MSVADECLFIHPQTQLSQRPSRMSDALSHTPLPYGSGHTYGMALSRHLRQDPGHHLTHTKLACASSFICIVSRRQKRDLGTIPTERPPQSMRLRPKSIRSPVVLMHRLSSARSRQTRQSALRMQGDCSELHPKALNLTENVIFRRLPPSEN